ncbi:MAG: TRAP transporter small permease [Beijerinckiaceae bacterium]|jgi:TRAP-type C4-dicarboxylate transport system permease small subunit|nr:TRAP transporter small permease [Beijerinckiaceae bacterium]
MQLYIAAVRRLSQIGGVFAALLILVSILVVCQMVFTRAVLGQSSIWQTEFVTFALISATFIGAPYILLTRGHVNVDILPLMLGQRGRVILAFIASAIGLLFCGVFFYNSIEWWYEAWSGNLTTPSMWRARLWIPYLSVPVGMGLLCLQYIADILALATGAAMPFGLTPEDTL